MIGPILPQLSAEQARAVLPLLLKLPTDSGGEAAHTEAALSGATMSDVLARMVHATPPPLPLSRLLLILHQMDVQKEGVSLKQVMAAVQFCLAERSLCSQGVLADALRQLCELEPLPLLTMRTMIQALIYFPKLGQVTRQHPPPPAPPITHPGPSHNPPLPVAPTHINSHSPKTPNP